MFPSTDVQSSSAADDGKFQRTRDHEAKVDDADVGATSSFSDVSAALQNVDLQSDSEAAASNVDSRSTGLFDNTLNNGHQNYIDRDDFTKRRKPPEYVGYAVNVDSDSYAQGQSKTLKGSLANNTGTDNSLGRKTNVIKLPLFDELYSYKWKSDEDRAWRTACRELNCVGGSKCVPDTLRDGRPRCQCPLGTDGHRCERRTSAMKLTYNHLRYVIMLN